VLVHTAEFVTRGLVLVTNLRAPGTGRDASAQLE
jgi:hypothetical protein